MIAKPEVLANQNDLHKIAKHQGDDLVSKIEAIDKVHLITKAVEESAASYYELAQAQIFRGLAEVGARSAQHYSEELGLNLSEEELNNIVIGLIQTQRVEEYYGATLDQRMYFNYARLKVSLKQASSISRDPEVRAYIMGRVFHTYGPYGNHVSKDERVLLSQSTYLEHEVAKELGHRAGVTFVKWTLSKDHVGEDICDDLAINVDKEVKRSLLAQNIPINSKGIYFIDQCPLPPHPNCQCTLVFVLEKASLTKTTARRTVENVVDLFKRVRRRRKRL